MPWRMQLHESVIESPPIISEFELLSMKEIIHLWLIRSCFQVCQDDFKWKTIYFIMARFLNFKKFMKDHADQTAVQLIWPKMCRCSVNHTRRHKIKITHSSNWSYSFKLFAYISIGANAFQSPHVAGAVTVERTFCSHTQTYSYGRWNYHPRAGLHRHQGQCCHHPMYQAFQMLPGSLWPEPRSRAFVLINLNRIT